MSNAVQRIEREEDTRALPMTPMDVVSHAMTNGATIEQLTKMMELQERYEATQARKAFDEALAQAKAEFEPIVKNRLVHYEGKGNSVTSYRHEDMAQIERQVGPVLARHGLSYRFKVNSDPNQPVRVTCVIAHRDGHSEETGLSAGADSSGSKNSIQAIGSAITYLQRYTLKAALGLAVAHDDDGAKAEETVVDRITEAQVMELRELNESVGGKEGLLTRHLKIERLSDLPSERFDEVIRVIKTFRGDR